jgi:hypothetical protein
MILSIFLIYPAASGLPVASSQMQTIGNFVILFTQKVNIRRKPLIYN